MSDPRLIDMEPGGESTQYESIRLYTQTPEKQTGQLGGTAAHTKSELWSIMTPADDAATNEDEDAMVQKLGMGTGAEDFDKENLDLDTLGDVAAAKARRLQGKEEHEVGIM
ncbi:uncharacterized protein N7482_001746 [Penicillium canariense]|uniref:Uncharacterized protein n=1 Tax=Penicillium canariense TaxID=189055 RepID=A0A9W9IE05_9EURO|nr:uncharacterized protein N7482_001746 [Penicillium canariense]KAJ5175869.1 hypothetical protein N7482_001746 [Penicillium canariense]